MSATVRYDLTVTAQSSIAHGGELLGTTTLLRRETILGPDGTRHEIPIVSGNALRAALRRTGEDLLRDILAYEGQISFAAAIALIGGGRLAKTTTTPLSGRRLLHLRELNPVISVFGASTAGACIEGSLDVGKLVPHLRETAHLTDAGKHAPAAFTATQQETYSRVDHSSKHRTLTLTTTDATETAAAPLAYQIETFPAGTRFSTWLQLSHATDLDIAFVDDLITTYASTGTIGGRTAAGHGRITATIERTVLRGHPAPCDWRAHLTTHRQAAIDALQELG